MITRLNFNPTTVSTEPEPEVTPQPAAPQAPALGVGSTQDAFENASPIMNSFGNLLEQPTQAPAALPVLNDPTVDASSMFDFVTEQAPAPPSEPPKEGLGQTLENFAEKTITDTYEKKTSKEFGPDPDRTTLSESATWGDDQKMPENLSSLGSGGGTTVGELKGSWNLAEFGKIDEKAEREWGSAYAKGSTQVLGVSGEIYYNAGVDLDKKTVSAGIGAKGSVEIVGAHYEAGYNTPSTSIGDEKIDLNGKVNADAYVGVKANAEANITLGGENNLKLGAGAFDGAHASISGKIGVDDIADTHGYLAGWTGVGAKAGFDVGYKDGKLDANMGLGLALGIGAEWDLGVTVDFSELADTGLEGMREMGLGDAADWIENTTGDVINFAGDAAHWAGDAAEDVGEALGDAADDTGDAIGDAVDAIGDAAGDIGDAAGDVAGDIGDTLDDWF